MPYSPLFVVHPKKQDPEPPSQIDQHDAVITLTDKQRLIVGELLEALEADQLELPVLPEMALKVRTLLDDPDCSTGQFVKLLSTDLAISLYLIKVANSAALFNGKPVGNLYDAIHRLGYQMLYSMVINITLTKLFKAKSPLINQKLHELWERSRIVAANSYVLAHKKKYLKPEDAILAGLINEIGAMPLYLYTDRLYPEIDIQSLELLIRIFSAPIGFRLLKSWNFPNTLINIVSNQINFRVIPKTEQADLVDVVTMANLQMQSASKKIVWTNVPAAERLGFYSGDCDFFFANNAEQFAAISNLLGLGSAQAT